MSSSPFREQQIEALREMRASKESLLPILGAGASTGLGVPTWQNLKEKIVEQIFKTEPQPYLNYEPSAVFDAALRRDPARYRAIVREQLVGLEGATTLLLRSVTRMPLSVFATTNLDHHLEFAFRNSDLLTNVVILREKKPDALHGTIVNRGCPMPGAQALGCRSPFSPLRLARVFKIRPSSPIFRLAASHEELAKETGAVVGGGSATERRWAAQPGDRAARLGQFINLGLADARRHPSDGHQGLRYLIEQLARILFLSERNREE